MKRRQFVGAGLAAAGAGMLGIRPAVAQSKTIAVMNWGGDWNSRTVKHIEAPLLEAKGWTIQRELGEQPPRLTKIIAEKRLPRGTVDIAHLGEAEAYTLHVNEALETLDYSKIPNAATMVQGMKRPFFLPWLWSGWELVYNPEKIKDPVTAYADMWNPKYAGKVGVMDQNYGNAMQTASIVASGKMNDFAGAQKMLLEWKKAVQPKVYPAHQQAQAALQSEEIWIMANYRARGLQFAKDGTKVLTAYPKEGAIYQVFGAVMPRRAANKDGAYTYLNALLDPTQLVSLCADNFYTPPITAVNLSGDVGKKIAYTPEQSAKLHYADNDYWAKNLTAWLDWWKKNFLA